MSPVVEAFQLRAHFHDACAALWRAGEFVQLEDLVLHDAGMDARSPTHELVRAHAVLLARRRIAVQPPNWALTASGLSVLRGSKSIGDACGNENTDVPPACKDSEEEPQLESGEKEPASSSEFEEIDALLARTSTPKQSPAAAPMMRESSRLIYDEDWDDEDARLSEWRQAIEETAPCRR